MQKFPIPFEESLRYSNRLINLIHEEILLNGAMSFAHFMQLALYTPGLGYYSAGATKFGQGGDFITAPELTPLFAQSLARQFQQVLTYLKEGDIFELGAGSGIFAADVLLELEKLNCLPNHYYILELSADLRERQQKLLQTRMPDYFSNIVWLDQLPKHKLTGIIFANEVLDAMPVHKFKWQHGLNEYFINWDHDQFVWELKPADLELMHAVDKLGINFSEDYESEINMHLAGWLKAVSDVLEKGLLLLIDYGFPRYEYYHPQRNMGTIMCHYRHHAHSDPLLWPGLQDITSHVDFTAVAEAAYANGLDLAGYTTQANFLLGCGIQELVQTDIENTALHWQRSQQLKKLLLPSEMGELFKAIAFTKSLALSLKGFSIMDMRERL